jgi:serine/threonine protein kinase
MEGGKGSSKDYEILSTLGKGSYGTVYKALNKNTQMTVALKINKVENPSEWLTQMAEIDNVIGIHHPTVVNYYNWFFENEELYLEMELCDGGSLSDTMYILKRALSELEICAVMKSVVDSIQYIHSLKKIHRDIKAGNVLLTSEGIPKLCDFGVAAQLDEQRMKTGTIVGSPYWMAPEIMKQDGYDTKVDIWSIGMTCLELVNGNPPYSELPPMVYLNKLILPTFQIPKPPESCSNEFKDFVKQCLTLDPIQRPDINTLAEHNFLKLLTDTKAKEVIMDLHDNFKAAKAEQKAKAHDDDDELEYEEEYEEEFEYEDDELPDDDAMSTLLVSGNADATFIPSGTVISDSTFIATEDTGTMITSSVGQQSSGLANYHPDFSSPVPVAPAPSANKNFLKMQKRQFSHFKVPQLIQTLESLQRMARKNLETGSVPQNVVKNNYNDIRNKIIDEMRKKGENVEDDYMAL